MLAVFTGVVLAFGTRTALAQDLTSCDPAALTAEMNVNTSAVQDMASRFQATSPSASGAELQTGSVPPSTIEIEGLLSSVTSLQNHLDTCRSQLAGANLEAAIVGSYVAAQVRVVLLKKLNRPQEAYNLASQTAASISGDLALAPDYSGKLGDLRTWMLSVQPPAETYNTANRGPTDSDFIAACQHQSANELHTSFQVELDTGICLMRQQHLAAAIGFFFNMLHGLSKDTDPSDVAHTYDELARAEFQLNQRQAAAQHIAAAYNCIEKATYDPFMKDQIAADYRRIAPAQYRRVQAASEAATRAQFAADTAGMSADEKRVYADEGAPDHVESYDSSDYHTEVWWYDDPEGGYRVGYTFTNGALTSVYRP